MLYPLTRRLLFCLPPEFSHYLTLRLLRHWGELLGSGKPLEGRRVQVFGREFANPLGLAAGLDKNASAIAGFARMGFGFVEVGTVTPRPQPGNPKPRMFRLPAHGALINRMGFNNLGVDQMRASIERARASGWCENIVLGVNLGKNKDTPLEEAVNDYLIGMRRLHDVADYFTLNLSSPNTPGLRTLQSGAALAGLLGRVKEEQQLLASGGAAAVPLLVKVAPDLAAEDIAIIAEQVALAQIDGVIATNTTISRDAVRGARHADEAGGLSGPPVQLLSLKTVTALRDRLPAGVPIVGVGGIDSPAAAQAMLAAGADLLQIYTSFIYQGPNLVRKIVRAI